MPIYIEFDGIKGKVDAPGHERSGAATGGVWKTTNFLTRDHSARTGGGPHVRVLSGSTDGGLMQVSQLTLETGGHQVDHRDPGARLKVGELFNMARAWQTKIKVFLCPSTPRASASVPNGQLYAETDQAAFQTGGSARLIVTDAGGMVLESYPVRNVRTSHHHPGGIQIMLCDGSVR